MKKISKKGFYRNLDVLAAEKFQKYFWLKQ